MLKKYLTHDKKNEVSVIYKNPRKEVRDYFLCILETEIF